jgi:uncharacterized protein
MFIKKLAKISCIPKKIVIFFIAIYQRLISPFLGQNCRFYPSCSQYAKIAVQRFGLIYGGWLILKRLARCHPFNSGGIDPVPNQSQIKHRYRV